MTLSLKIECKSHCEIFSAHKGNIKPDPEMGSQFIYHSTRLVLLVTDIPLLKFARVGFARNRARKVGGMTKGRKFQKKNSNVFFILQGHVI